MADDWASYFCNVNDKLASIFLNLGLAGDAPIASKPWLLWAWVYLQKPRPDGLSDGNEAPTLFLIEDALNLQLERNCRAILCGRITTEGRREFYFYAETKHGFRTAVETALTGFHGYRFNFGEQEDSMWKQYFNVLHPSRDDLQRIKNRQLLDLLQKQGDVLSIAREVQHWIYFPSEQSRACFREEAINAGFKVGYESQVEGDHPFGITVLRTQPVEQELIDNTVIELLRLAQQVRGQYDGWETPVTTE
jgi:regulator of RNase E activity RraB